MDNRYNKIYFGNNEISKIYYESNLVWSSAHNVTIAASGTDYLSTWSFTYGDTTVTKPIDGTVYEIEDGTALSVSVTPKTGSDTTYTPSTILYPKASWLATGKSATISNSMSYDATLWIATNSSGPYESAGVVSKNSSITIDTSANTTYYAHFSVDATVTITNWEYTSSASIGLSTCTDDTVATFSGSSTKITTSTETDTETILSGTTSFMTYTRHTLTITLNTGVASVKVTRTSSPNAGASIGTLSNGDTIYYGDELSVSATASTGYTMDSYATSYTVTGNIIVAPTASPKHLELTLTKISSYVWTVRISNPNSFAVTAFYNKTKVKSGYMSSYSQARSQTLASVSISAYSITTITMADAALYSDVEGGAYFYYNGHYYGTYIDCTDTSSSASYPTTTSGIWMY